MAKKFFYDRVYNTRRTITNIIIISVCVIGIIICFIITSNFQGKGEKKEEKSLNIKNEVTVEVNETYENSIFFSKMDNVDIEDIKIEYEDGFSISEPGRYKVTIIINKKKYDSKLIVVDTIKPILAVKEVTINENETYNPNDFVSECTDNSLKKCTIDYAEAYDEEGNIIDFSSYTEAGTYPIKISARDNSDNEVTEDVKLYIKKKTQTAPPVEKPKVCRYGNDEYDTEKYVMTNKVTTDGCAISLNLYKDTAKSEKVDKMMEKETIRIKKDVDALNLTGTLALNRKVSAVINTSGSGIIGFELSMVVTLTNDDITSIVANYKIDSTGKRVFTENPYNLAE